MEINLLYGIVEILCVVAFVVTGIIYSVKYYKDYKKLYDGAEECKSESDQYINQYFKEDVKYTEKIAVVAIIMLAFLPIIFLLNPVYVNVYDFVEKITIAALVVSLVMVCLSVMQLLLRRNSSQPRIFQIVSILFLAGSLFLYMCIEWMVYGDLLKSAGVIHLRAPFFILLSGFCIWLVRMLNDSHRSKVHYKAITRTHKLLIRKSDINGDWNKQA